MEEYCRIVYYSYAGVWKRYIAPQAGIRTAVICNVIPHGGMPCYGAEVSKIDVSH